MRRRILIWLLAVLVCAGAATVLESCGPVRSYWGVEGGYDSDHHHHKKPKKHKKHKKHYKHHHHDDDDD